jgi:hypothetical protein
MEEEYSGPMWRPDACSYAWGIEVLRLINGGPQLFNKSCFRSVNFVVVVFVVVVQEEEQTKEGSKPRHGIWN